MSAFEAASRPAIAVAVLISIGIIGIVSCSDRGEAGEVRSQRAGTTTEGPIVQVTDLSLGSGVDDDNRIDGTTDSFSPDETVWVSVETRGDGNHGTLTARWTYENGQLVDAISQDVDGVGSSATAFRIAQPGGLPEGRYTVEILLDGDPAGELDFTVGS